MMKWNKFEKMFALQLKEKGAKPADIVDALNISYGNSRTVSALKSMFKREKKQNKGLTRQPTNIEDMSSVRFRDAVTKLQKEREKLNRRSKQCTISNGRLTGDKIKILTVSDLHVPLVNDSVVNDAIDLHGDADILVVNGDFLDQNSVSCFLNDKHMALKYEYELGMDYLRQLSKMFKHVFLVRGNHDSRVGRSLMSNIDKETTFMVKKDVIKQMAKGMDFDENGDFMQMHNITNVHYESGLGYWYVKIGNCIFAHPSGGSKIPMRTSQNVCEYFLDKVDFDMIVVAHTHKMGKIFYRNKVIIEQGCACLPMDYEADPKLKFGLQVFGYAVVYMDNDGNVDFNDSNPVYYGSASALDNKKHHSISDYV